MSTWPILLDPNDPSQGNHAVNPDGTPIGDPDQPRMADWGGLTGNIGTYRGNKIDLTDPSLAARLQQLQTVRDYLYGNIEDTNQSAKDEQMGLAALANMFATAGGVQKGVLPDATPFLNASNNFANNSNKLDYTKLGGEEDTFNALTKAARQSYEDTVSKDNTDYARKQQELQNNRTKYEPAILMGDDGKQMYARYNKDTGKYEDLSGKTISNPRPITKGEYEMKELDDGNMAIFNKNTGQLVTGAVPGGTGMSKELRKKASDDQAALYGAVQDSQDAATLADRYVDALDRVNKNSWIGTGPLDGAINSTVGSINQVLGTNMLDTKERQEVAAYQKQLELRAAQLSMKGQGAITEGERAILSQSLGNMGDPAVARKVAEIIKSNAERTGKMAQDWDAARKGGEKDFYSWRTKWLGENAPKGVKTAPTALPSDAVETGGGYYYSPSTGKYYKVQ